MERMWSPWRSRYLDQPAQPGIQNENGRSIFSRLAEEARDEQNLILWRGRHVFVIMNSYPYNNGHLLIVPFRQVAAYEDLTTAEQEEIAHTIQRCIRWLQQALRPEGFNVGMNLGAAAGAGIPEHLHVHVVPRWQSDTNFMPTLGEVKVIPEALRTTYNKLRHAIDASPEEASPL
ncbi:MAG: HIT domain-containing protein [Rhodothermales bacterium]